MRGRVFAAACALAVAACSAAEAPRETGTVVHVDDEGWFVSAEPVAGRWYPSRGVRILVPHEADGPLLGRLADGARTADELELATFDDEGVLHFVPLRTERSARSHASAVRGALADALASLPGTIAPALADGLRGVESSAVPAHEVPTVTNVVPGVDLVPGDGPPERGAPLAAWAPRQCAFARFRSVEAGYRLAGTLDEFVGRVLAGHGDARDAATLRLTLFHLLLPTIWRTNPGVSKGVSEMGLVVFGPYARGPLDVAVLLRIEDAARHEMHTKAGIAIESKPDHLWQPANDPFPEERVRRSVRRIVGDIEIVATNPVLLEWLASGVRESWADDAHAAAFLADPGGGQGDLACTAIFPPDQEVDLDVGLCARATRGVAHLLGELGVQDTGGARVVPTLGSMPFPIRRLECRTDRTGLHVIATLDGRSTLTEAIVRGTEIGAHERYAAACGAARGDLAVLALLSGAAGNTPERALVLFGFAPRCPEDGVLRTDAVTRAVTCSLHGPPDTRTFEPGTRRVPSPFSTFGGGADEIQITLPIDWSER